MGEKISDLKEREKMSSQTIRIKNIRLKSAAEVPKDVSETPGGTMFAFTPGGTKIVYTRDYMMSLKHSPASMTPPKGMANIPGVTCPVSPLAQDNKTSTATAQQFNDKKERHASHVDSIPEDEEMDMEM